MIPTLSLAQYHDHHGPDECHLYGSSNSVSTFIPPPPLNIESQTAVIIIDFDQTDFAGEPDKIAAIEYAASIWETLITSNVVIRIDAKYEPLGGAIAAANPIYDSDIPPHDFVPATGENFHSNTNYMPALANKIAHTDLTPSLADMQIRFHSGRPWYEGTDGLTPSSQYDLVSSALHEIGHGIGISTIMYYTLTSPWQAFWGYLTSPRMHVYDRFYENSMGEDVEDIASVVTLSPALYSYLISQDIYWVGDAGMIGNGNSPIKLQADLPLFNDPNNLKANIVHLDEALYGPGDDNSLLTPLLAKGEAIHHPNSAILGMLEDIGWDLSYGVGLEDYIRITYGNTVLYPGQSIGQSGTFFDVAPTGDYPVSSYWEIELYHKQGTHILQTKTGTSNLDWIDNLTTLPSGYEWLRNPDGSTRGKISLSVVDNDGITHEDTKNIGVAFAPNTPDVALHPQSSTEATLAFYAKGATSYEIHYGTTEGGPYTGTAATEGNSPITHASRSPLFTLHGLTSGTTYYATVRGINAYGQSSLGNEISFTIDCTPFSGSFDLPSQVCPNFPIVLDGSAVPNDANPEDGFTITITNNGQSSVYFKYGKIGIYDLKHLEQDFQRTSGPAATFLTGQSYDVTLSYEICETAYDLTETVSIIQSYKYYNPQCEHSPLREGDLGSENSIFFSVFPNPSAGKLFFQIDEDIDLSSCRIELWNVQGQKINKWHPRSHHDQIHLMGQIDGLYLIRFLLGEDEVALQKIILQK